MEETVKATVDEHTLPSGEVSRWCSLLRDEDAATRHYAAERLIEVGDQTVLPELKHMALYDTGSMSVEGEMCDYSVEVYQAAFRALEVIYERVGVRPPDIARLTHLLYHEPELGGEHEARLIRLLALGGAAMRPVLHEALHSPNVLAGIRALYALETLEEPDLGIAQLSHPEPQVRRAAASLWPVRSETWIAAAIARLAIEPDAGVRERLVQAAAQTPIWWGDEFYHRHFPDEAERWARLHEAGLRALLRCGRDPEPAVRLAAARWLAQFTRLIKRGPAPEAVSDALAWAEAEKEPGIRAELLRYLPVHKWQRAARRVPDETADPSVC